MRLSIHITGPNGKNRREVFDQDVIKIGSLASSGIVVTGQNVARMHAVIEVTRDEVRLIDLGSDSGTSINDVRVDKNAAIATGDVVSIGEWRLCVTYKTANDTEWSQTPPPPPVTAVQAWRDAFGRLHNTPEAARAASFRAQREAAVDLLLDPVTKSWTAEARAKLREHLMSTAADDRIVALADVIQQANASGE